MKSRILFGCVATTLVLAACGGTSTLQEAAETFVAPEEFVAVSQDTSNTFEENIRDYRFSTDASQEQACQLAEQALSEWTSDAVQAEPTSEAMVCGFIVRSPSDHVGSVDTAIIRVSRASDDAGFIQDPTISGGVHAISATFATDK